MRPVPVLCGNKKGKKCGGDDPQGEKTEVLEEGEIAAWFLT